MNLIALLGLDVWLARWRTFTAEGARAAEDRLELARLEWLEHKRRLGQALLLALVVVVVTVVALLLLSLALLVQFWDTPQRSLVAWLLAAGWCAVWLGTVMALLSVLRRIGPAFAFTRQELRKDWHALKGRL